MGGPEPTAGTWKTYTADAHTSTAYQPPDLNQVDIAGAIALAHEQRMNERLDEIGLRQVLVGAQEICAQKYHGQPLWILVMRMFGLGGTFARGLCLRAGIDPDHPVGAALSQGAQAPVHTKANSNG